MNIYCIGHPDNTTELIAEMNECLEKSMKEQIDRLEKDSLSIYLKEKSEEDKKILKRLKKESNKIKKHFDQFKSIECPCVQENKNYIYVMLDENTGQYKIGRSKNPIYREKTLQCEKPTIEMKFYYEGTNEDEKKLHKRFEGKRTRGEWFLLKKSDLKKIKKYFNN